MKYKVVIARSLLTVYEIESDNSDDAIDAATELYEEGKLGILNDEPGEWEVVDWEPVTP